MVRIWLFPVFSDQLSIRHGNRYCGAAGWLAGRLQSPRLCQGILEVTHGADIATLHEFTVPMLTAFASNGTNLIVGSEDSLYIFDISDASNPAKKLQMEMSKVTSIDFSGNVALLGLSE